MLGPRVGDSSGCAPSKLERPHPNPWGVSVLPLWAALPGLCLCLFLCVGAARLVLMVCALVRLSALLLPALLLVCLLVRLSVGRCVWLLLPGLPRVAAGVLLLWWLLLSLRPRPPWLLPLLVVLLSLLVLPRRARPAPLSLARCALLPRARGGPLRRPSRCAVEALPVVHWLRWVCPPRLRRSRGLAIRARPQAFRVAMQLPRPCRQGLRQ